MSKEISRRTFIKGGVAVGAAVAAGTYFKWEGKNIPAAVREGNVTYDVLIIGSGGAGMRAALEAGKDKNIRVAVMTKMIPTRSASTMAQGGMNGCTGVTDPKAVWNHICLIRSRVPIIFATRMLLNILLKWQEKQFMKWIIWVIRITVRKMAPFISAKWAEVHMPVPLTMKIARDMRWYMRFSNNVLPIM